MAIEYDYKCKTCGKVKTVTNKMLRESQAPTCCGADMAREWGTNIIMGGGKHFYCNQK